MSDETHTEQGQGIDQRLNQLSDRIDQLAQLLQFSLQQNQQPRKNVEQPFNSVHAATAINPWAVQNERVDLDTEQSDDESFWFYMLKDPHTQQAVGQQQQYNDSLGMDSHVCGKDVQVATGVVANYSEQLAVGLQTAINSNNVVNGHETTNAADMQLSSMVVEPDAGTIQPEDALLSPMQSVMEAPSEGVAAENAVLNDATACSSQDAENAAGEPVHDASPFLNQDAIALAGKAVLQYLSVVEGGRRFRQHQPKPTSFGTPADAFVHLHRSTAAVGFPYDPGIHSTIPGATQARKMSVYKADELVRLCNVGRRGPSSRGSKVNDGPCVVYPVTTPEASPRRGAQHTVPCSAITSHQLILYSGGGGVAYATRGLPSHTWILPVSG